MTQPNYTAAAAFVSLLACVLIFFASLDILYEWLAQWESAH